MICIQKTYGFQGLNHQIIEESSDVTPVMNERKIVQYSELNQKPQKTTRQKDIYCVQVYTFAPCTLLYHIYKDLINS